MVDLGIDSKLRACDLMQLRVRDICHGERIVARTIVMQQKTKRPVQFEITDQTQDAVAARIKEKNLNTDRLAKNLRAVQLLLGHTKLESTVRYVGIEVDDALKLAEQTEV